MPLEIQCPHCRRNFRVPEKYAGKRVKCPECEGTIGIPAAGQPAPKEPVRSEEAAPEQAGPDRPAAQRWYLRTEEGQQFGPASQEELNGWLAEGRIDASCQVLCEGWEQWKWADEVFPDLAEDSTETQPADVAAEENPFAGIGERVAQEEAITPFEAMREDARVAIRPAPGKGGVAGGGEITSGMRQALAQTQPWVTFLSILWFILGGLMTVGLLILMAFRGTFGLSFAIPGLVSVAPFLAATYFLFRYGRRIKTFLRRNGDRDLEDALVAQKSYWKFVGIVTLIVLVLQVVAVLLIAAMGGFAASTFLVWPD